MEVTINPLYESLYDENCKCRYFHFWGGRGRGGSHVATDYFLFRLTMPHYFRGGMFRATFSSVKSGLWVALKLRIIKAVEKGHVRLKDFAFNDQELRVTYIPTGNSIICKGFRASTLAEKAKMKGIEGLSHAIIDEAEDIEESEVDQLDDTMRTTEVNKIQLIFLFNPPHKTHWLIKRFYNLIPSDYEGWYNAVKKVNKHLCSVHSTFKDNTDNLNESTIVKNISYGNPNSPYYNLETYCRDVLGLVSEGKKGRIYTKVQPITDDEFNKLPYPSFYGLDFGFSNDPAAGVHLKLHNGNLYAKQIVYERGLDNEQLADKLKIAGVSKYQVFADSSEPKSISELNKRGLYVIAAVKGPDSIRAGIKELQSYNIYACESSLDLWDELEQYHWQLDGDKNPTDQPIDDHNHLMDAMRYGVMNYKKRQGASLVIGSGNNEIEHKRDFVTDKYDNPISSDLEDIIFDDDEDY